ncbi:MAG: putative quinol monooxygenase [Pseudomonadota bacterium]
MIAVCVTLRIKPGQFSAFLAALRAHGQRCLDREADCHRFEICTDGAEPDGLFIYEVYSNRAAFDAHLQSDHFLAFDADVSAMVAQKDIAIWGQIEPL